MQLFILKCSVTLTTRRSIGTLSQLSFFATSTARTAEGLDLVLPYDQLPQHGDEVRAEGAAAPGDDQDLEIPQDRVLAAVARHQYPECTCAYYPVLIPQGCLRYGFLINEIFLITSALL